MRAIAMLFREKSNYRIERDGCPSFPHRFPTRGRSYVDHCGQGRFRKWPAVSRPSSRARRTPPPSHPSSGRGVSVVILGNRPRDAPCPGRLCRRYAEDAIASLRRGDLRGTFGPAAGGADARYGMRCTIIGPVDAARYGSRLPTHDNAWCGRPLRRAIQSRPRAERRPYPALPPRFLRGGTRSDHG